MSGTIRYLSFCPYLTQHTILKFHPCSMWQGFHPFKGCIIFHCMALPRVLLSFVYLWTPGCFHHWVLVNHAGMNVGVQIPLLRSSFQVLDIYPGRLLGHMVIVFLIFWGVSILTSLMAAHPPGSLSTLLLWVTTRCFRLHLEFSLLQSWHQPFFWSPGSLSGRTSFKAKIWALCCMHYHGAITPAKSSQWAVRKYLRLCLFPHHPSLC